MNILENFEEILTQLYGNNKIELARQLNRYNNLFNLFSEKFTENEVYLFSTPGRTEISGNHTDHNLGKVIASSVNLDSIAVASKSEDDQIIVYSEGYEKPFEINVKEIEKLTEEIGTTNSLIKGIVARFLELGFSVGGFKAVITSDVLPGSGLSSSASIEVLIGNILNTLYNDDKIENEELAKIGQWAENNYFGKPCGLMDQMACASGGIIAIDFEDQENPIVEKVNFDFVAQNYKLLIIDSGSNHEDLTEDYASVPTEMKSVANKLGDDVLRKVDEEKFIDEIKNLRKQVGDRAILRALHYYEENKRVSKQIAALKRNDFSEFLKLVIDSGNSSAKWLQNIYSTKNVNEQGVSIALAFTEKFINEKGEGAYRVHGGGFAGTIQAFLPNKFVKEYKNFIENILGKNKVIELTIRQQGTVCLNSI